MTHPFEGRDDGPHAEGFGFGPFDPHSRRAMHHARREARREMRGLLKGQALAQAGAAASASDPALAQAAPGSASDAGGPRGGHVAAGRGRGRRGDVRAAILALLTERPMHGYEMIQEIAARSNGLWRPSPGSVYPTLQLLVDEGLIVATESEGSKRLFELTDDGEKPPRRRRPRRGKRSPRAPTPDEVNLRARFGQFAAAVFQSATRCLHPISRSAFSTSSTTPAARSTACWARPNSTPRNKARTARSC